MEPSLRFRPLRPGVASDAASSLDLLVTISPPPLPPEAAAKARPPLNLALVIDRSGSMNGRKLSHARKAARFLVSQLQASDRLALISFDDRVQVMLPSTPVRHPRTFLEAINGLRSGGMTALFEGWRSGALQAAEHLDPAALNRVLLLSDGQANNGLTDTGAIAEAVAGLSRRGVSTSAFGLGDDFDEDLMGAIAAAGDGTLAHIQSPQQLEELYAAELMGLATTFASQLSLEIRPAEGVAGLEVLNDLPLTPTGNHQLPALRYGQEIQVALRLTMPTWAADQEIASIRLNWHPTGSSERQHLIQPLVLPVMAAAELEALPPDPVVAEEFAIHAANRARRQAMEQLDHGDVLAAEHTLHQVTHTLARLAPTQRSRHELQLLREKASLLFKDRNWARKSLSREAFRSSLEVWGGNQGNN